MAIEKGPLAVESEKYIKDLIPGIVGAARKKGTAVTPNRVGMGAKQRGLYNQLLAGQFGGAQERLANQGVGTLGTAQATAQQLRETATGMRPGLTAQERANFMAQQRQTAIGSQEYELGSQAIEQAADKQLQARMGSIYRQAANSGNVGSSRAAIAEGVAAGESQAGVTSAKAQLLGDLMGRRGAAGASALEGADAYGLKRQALTQSGLAQAGSQFGNISEQQVTTGAELGNQELKKILTQLKAGQAIQTEDQQAALEKAIRARATNSQEYDQMMAALQPLTSIRSGSYMGVKAEKPDYKGQVAASLASVGGAAIIDKLIDSL